MLDPKIGRWMEEDPDGFAAGDADLYRYVGNDPTNATLGLLLYLLGSPEPATGKDPVALAGHTEAVWCVAFSPDGRSLVSCSDDRTVKVWDVPPGKERSSFTTGEAGYLSLAFSPDGKTLALGGSGVQLRAADGTDHLAPFQAQEKFTSRIRFSPDGKALAVSSREKSGRVGLYDLATGRRRELILGGHGGIGGIAFTPDARVLAAGYGDGAIGIWNVRTGDSSLLEGHQGAVLSVAFSPDGKSLASSGWDGTLRIWDVTTGRCHVVFRDEHPVMSVAFSPDGSLLAAACSDEKSVKAYETKTHKLLTTLRGHNEPVLCVAFSPDGKKLASGGGNIVAPDHPGEVLLWDVPVPPLPPLRKSHATSHSVRTTRAPGTGGANPTPGAAP